METASVKVMLSYDYCHFEIALSGEVASIEDVDNMRKEAQRLADKAVKQYKIAKADISRRIHTERDLARLQKQADILKENFPKSEWSPKQKALIKSLEDARYHLNFIYDYEDKWDWDENGERNTGP